MEKVKMIFNKKILTLLFLLSFVSENAYAQISTSNNQPNSTKFIGSNINGIKPLSNANGIKPLSNSNGIKPLSMANSLLKIPTLNNQFNINKYDGPTLYMNNLPLPPAIAPSKESIINEEKLAQKEKKIPLPPDLAPKPPTDDNKNIKTNIETSTVVSQVLPPVKPAGCNIGSSVDLSTLLNPACLNYIKESASFKNSPNGTLFPPPPSVIQNNVENLNSISSNLSSIGNIGNSSSMISQPSVPCQVFIQPLEKPVSSGPVSAIQPMLTTFNTTDLKECIEVGVRLTFGIPSITNILVHNDTYGVVAITCIRNQNLNNEVKCSQQPSNLQGPETVQDTDTTQNSKVLDEKPLNNESTVTKDANGNKDDNKNLNNGSYHVGLPRAIVEN
jgi:hypothetical protein